MINFQCFRKFSAKIKSLALAMLDFPYFKIWVEDVKANVGLSSVPLTMSERLSHCEQPYKCSH